MFAVGDVCYAAAHCQADRLMTGCVFHSYTVRLNIISMCEQLSQGVPPEMYKCVASLPHELDQSLAATGYGKEGFKGCMLGYNK